MIPLFRKLESCSKRTKRKKFGGNEWYGDNDGGWREREHQSACVCEGGCGRVCVRIFFSPKRGLYIGKADSLAPTRACTMGKPIPLVRTRASTMGKPTPLYQRDLELWHKTRFCTNQSDCTSVVSFGSAPFVSFGSVSF